MNIQKVKDDIDKIVSQAITADMVDGRYGSQPFTDQILNLTYNDFTIRQALETILTIKKDECLAVVKESAELPAYHGRPTYFRTPEHIIHKMSQLDLLNAKFMQVTLMVYPSPLTKSRDIGGESGKS